MIRDIFAQILRTLWAHKLRSLLTMFGVSWVWDRCCCSSVWARGSARETSVGWPNTGKTSCLSSPGRAPAVAGSMNSARNYLLTYQDYADIRKEAPHVRQASPVLARDDMRAVSEFATANGQIVGVEPQFSEIRFLPVKRGAQRTREIGVEKALGARRSHILLQFLAESLTITFIGGALGVILAYGVSLSVGRLTLYSAMAKNAEAGDVRLIIAPSTLIVATLILAAVGLVSGMVPAIRAARLDPIEALRYE